MEAYMPKTDTYIEKEATINEEIAKFRHAATQNLLTRRNCVIISLVSCIYGIGNVQDYIIMWSVFSGRLDVVLLSFPPKLQEIKIKTERINRFFLIFLSLHGFFNFITTI